MKWMEKVDPDLRRIYRYFLPHKWRLFNGVSQHVVRDGDFAR